MPVLHFDDVRFAHPGRPPVPVLDGVTFAVHARERVALIGRSGAGKSTVLHLASGRTTAPAGGVSVLGHELAALSENARADLRLAHIAHVHQDFRLLPRFTALDNVALPLRLQGIGRDDARDRARVALARVDLASRATHRPSQLSGGEQQRVAIARAVVREPSLLLADEPTGSLDAALRDEILTLMFTVCAESAILLVTHDPVVAEAADRAIELTR